jgi:hypothetical protein
MGKTFRKMTGQFDDDSRKPHGKALRHASGRKHGGMRIINDPFPDDDDYFDDDVSVEDVIIINKSSDEHS